jgi:hypothetical protein
LECSWAPFGFWLGYRALSFVLFDAIIKLHAMDGKKMFNDFLIGKQDWNLISNNGLFDSWF